MEEDKSWKDYVFEEPVDGKRTYKYEKDHSHDVSYENERKHNNVHSPSHYMHGKKETIDVIRDCMENDEYHGYLKGNVLKYVSRYKFKGEPLEDLQKASWYLNRLIKEVSNGAS
jgi:nicotinic acid phosphoribosyltransferase